MPIQTEVIAPATALSAGGAARFPWFQDAKPTHSLASVPASTLDCAGREALSAFRLQLGTDRAPA